MQKCEMVDLFRYERELRLKYPKELVRNIIDRIIVEHSREHTMDPKRLLGDTKFVFLLYRSKSARGNSEELVGLPPLDDALSLTAPKR